MNDLVNIIYWLLDSIFYFLSSPFIFIILLTFILFYNLLKIMLRDKPFEEKLKNSFFPNEVNIDYLERTPLVNLVIPAWKEGEIFKQNLETITQMKYPKLKVIVNAGGDEKTIEIAESFKKYDNFLVLRQKKGGKIKALNDCFKYITEGIIYLTDADVLITDELIIRLILPIVNNNEDVCISGDRPLKVQAKIDLVKYLQINRNPYFLHEFNRYIEVDKNLIEKEGSTPSISVRSGASFSLKYEVLQAIGKFNEDRPYAEDTSRALDIISKGYRIYRISDIEAKIPTDYATTIREYFIQNIRYLEGRILFLFKNNKKELLKYFGLLIISTYLYVFPIFLYFNYGLLIIGFLLLLSLYLKKVRKIRFFLKTTKKDYYEKLNFILYLKIIFYIYLEALVNIYVLFELIFSKNKVKERYIYFE